MLNQRAPKSPGKTQRPNLVSVSPRADSMGRSPRSPLPRLMGEKSWSGRRGSNPLPQPWEGRALPDELLPLGRPPILGLDNSLGLRGGLGHDGPHELRVLLDEPVRVPG